jgi:hypothetical protein
MSFHADETVLLVGDPGQLAPVASELRSSGLTVNRVITLSEVVEMLSRSTWPSLVVVDYRGAQPWQVASMERMAMIAAAASIPLLRIGGPRLVRGPGALPAEASVDDIVGAARAICDGRSEGCPPEPPPAVRPPVPAPSPEPSR